VPKVRGTGAFFSSCTTPSKNTDNLNCLLDVVSLVPELTLNGVTFNHGAPL
jgi:hypothetical protein